MMENVDRRVLAGFCCVDAMTQGSIRDPLAVQAGQLVLRRNRSGIFAVMDAPQLTTYTTEFLVSDPGKWPSPTNFEVTIEDPSMRYLSRRANIAVPQPLPGASTTGGPAPTTTASAAPTTTPAGATPSPTTTASAAPPSPTTTPPAATSQIPPVTTPQNVVLYPTPAAPVGLSWAVIRVSVASNATPPAPLPWAVIQVTGTGITTATGLTNPNGEALLAVPGLGLTLSSSSTGAVTEATTPATVTAWFDPGSLKQPQGWISNPDDILLNLSKPSPPWKTVSQAVALGPGQTVFVALTISL
jgi:hypothetical protein